MAQVQITEEHLRVVMGRIERLAALHADVEVATDQVLEVASVSDGLRAVRGLRAPGTGVPGFLLYGTTRGSFGRDFVAVRGHGPAVVIRLKGGEFVRLVVSTSEAAALAADWRARS